MTPIQFLFGANEGTPRFWRGFVVVVAATPVVVMAGVALVTAASMLFVLSL